MNKQLIPEVSIIMSTYNDALFIKSTIESVINQTFKNWEFIIVDDASTDETGQIIKQIAKKDKRIKYLRNKINMGGPAKNINKAIAKSNANFIANIDGDDTWTDPNKLKKQVTFLKENPDYGMIGTFANAVDIKNKKLFEIVYPILDKDIKNNILRHSCYIHSTIMMRKKVLIKIGMYNTEYRYAGDYDLFLKMGTVSKLHNIPEFMINYRINPQGISRKTYLKQHREVIKIIKKYRNFYPQYLIGFILWNLRKLHPVWFRGSVSRNIKKYFSIKTT